MSDGIAYPGAIRRRVAALRVFLLSLLMLVAQGASAEPVLAGQLLDSAKQIHAHLKLQHQIAKMNLQAGQSDAAVMAFTLERSEAIALSAKLSRLYSENQSTFQNGQYLNATAQQQAISYNQTAKQSSMRLDMQLMMLTMQPTSQIDLMMAEMEMELLARRMTQLEQAMIAAQQ